MCLPLETVLGELSSARPNLGGGRNVVSIFAFVLPALRVVGVIAGYGLRVADHTLPILLTVLLTLIVVPTLVQNHQLFPFAAPLAWLLWAVLKVAVTSRWPAHSSWNFLSKDLSCNEMYLFL